MTLTLKTVRNAAELVGARVRVVNYDGYRHYVVTQDGEPVSGEDTDLNDVMSTLEAYFGGHERYADALAEVA